MAGYAASHAESVKGYLATHNVSLANLPTFSTTLAQLLYGKTNTFAQEAASGDGAALRELLEMTEECYRQAVDVFGPLKFDFYLPSPSLAPYAPGLTLPWANSSHPADCQWAEFWFQVLANCPDGPTLFNPRAKFPRYIRKCCPHLADVPRYLFRAFDDSSSGLSNSEVVASEQSISGSIFQGHLSRIDLFSRPCAEAARMLYAHLDKDCFGAGSPDDNLMSWSSSLSHVIQYSIWRARHHASRHRRAPIQVRICAVDTTKFPIGQFIRDTELIRLYREEDDGKIAKSDRRMQQFFNFRLDNRQYDNGEFLSQGQVRHFGRSCVITLDQLEEAGLYDLHPELADETTEWTKRMVCLRSRWSSYDYPTTSHEIDAARCLAERCFPEFNTPDMMLLLLAFKNRKRTRNAMTATMNSPLRAASCEFRKECQKDLRHCGPEEVQRYIEIQDAISTCQNRASAFPTPSSSNTSSNALDWLESQRVQPTWAQGCS